MKKLSLSLLAAATLAACGTNAVRTDSAVYVTPVPNADVRAGNGKIMELLDPTGPVNGVSWQRMALRMDDGSLQVLDRRGQQVAMGETVRVRSDATLKRDPNATKATP
jgi:hypothetical protein